ncbi:Renin-1 [Zootermopsis nevadensis]|uniref:Renin-1 n=1 Tax=Zootermopsis nevadensis TaxID=136037 RepID=A0A067RU26_ZOONE|nr:Renin-1 [Zootermopsis nevadensis]
MILGGSDPKLYIGNLKYVNIIAKDVLMVGVDSFAVDGVEISGTDKYDAVVDTGSTAIYVPRPLYYQLPKQLTANGQRQQLPCDQLHGLPNLNFRLGGHDFSLERDFYVSRDESGFCQILVFPTTDDEDPFVLGAVFLRKYYSEFNMNDMTIGLAPAV